MLAGGPAVAHGRPDRRQRRRRHDQRQAGAEGRLQRRPVRDLGRRGLGCCCSLTDVPRVGRRDPVRRPRTWSAILGVATVFFVVNSALVSTVVALAQGVINLGRYLANDLFFQASTAGLLLGLSPIVVLAAEFSLPALAAAAAAVPRGPPRRPRRDREGAPVAARRAHRAARTARSSATASSRRSPPAAARTSPRP